VATQPDANDIDGGTKIRPLYLTAHIFKSPSWFVQDFPNTRHFNFQQYCKIVFCLNIRSVRSLRCPVALRIQYDILCSLTWLQRIRFKTAVMVKVHSRLGSIIPGSTMQTNIILPPTLVGPICDPPRLANSTFLAQRLTTGSEVLPSMDQLSELRSPDISLDVIKTRLKTFLFTCWLSALGVFYSNFALYKCP